MSSGWNRDGLETFNKLAKEVVKDRKKHGVIFDKAFTLCEEAKDKATKTTRKRTRNVVDIYSDLNGGAAIENREEDSDSDTENWVAKNVYIV